MAKVLERLRIHRISLVDEPASQDPNSDFGAFVTLYKAAPMPETKKCSECGYEMPKDATKCPHCGAPVASESSEGNMNIDEAKAALATAQADLKAAEDLATEEQKKRETAEGEVAKLKLELTKARMTPEAAEQKIAKLEADLKVARMSPEERKKAERAELPESVRKQLEDSETKIAKLEDAAEATEYESRAKALNLKGISPAKLGPVLKRIAKGQSTTEDLADLERLFKALAEQVRNGRLFDEFGKGGFDNGEPRAADKVMGRAKELQKNDSKLGIADAITQVLKADAELNEAYMAESRGQA